MLVAIELSIYKLNFSNETKTQRFQVGLSNLPSTDLPGTRWHKWTVVLGHGRKTNSRLSIKNIGVTIATSLILSHAPAGPCILAHGTLVVDVVLWA